MSRLNGMSLIGCGLCMDFWNGNPTRGERASMFRHLTQCRGCRWRTAGGDFPFGLMADARERAEATLDGDLADREFVETLTGRLQQPSPSGSVAR
jgi:hypothetical protein